MGRIKVTPGDVAHVIFDMYIDNPHLDHGFTVKEIAEYMKMAETTVRRHLSDLGAATSWVSYCKRSIPIKERSYGTVIQHRMVDAWKPSSSFIRAQYIEMAKELDCYKDDNRILRASQPR